MRVTEKVVMVLGLAIPLIVILIGWPMLTSFVAGPAPSRSEVSAATPTALPVARATAAAPRPTNGPRQVQAPAAQETPSVAGVQAGGPTQAVSSFYTRVAQHDFDGAATLWSPRMRAAFPTDSNIAQRFGQTAWVDLQRLEVVSQDSQQATVAVDVLEATTSAGQRHFVGTWRLVRGTDGWLLDQPDLQPAP